VQDLPPRVGEEVGLVSLLELMREYSIKQLVALLTGLLRASDIMESAHKRSLPAPPDMLPRVSKVLKGFHVLGSEIELDSSLISEIKKLTDELINETCTLSPLVIKTRLTLIIEGLQDNLGSRKFMYVPKDQASYWDNPDLFGDDFAIGFPVVAVREMIEARNCYAAGRWTACVFHSMRVAEYGLRRLAKGLHVTISDKGKNCPLEYGDWDTVITAIRNKIAEARKLPRGEKKEKSLQFYSTAADHCEYMKDIWRNEVSHTRRRYSKPEGLAVFNRVKEFIQPLAKSDAKKVVDKGVRKRRLLLAGKALAGQTVSLRDLLSGKISVGEELPEDKS
jgi:hypothetical protein